MELIHDYPLSWKPDRKNIKRPFFKSIVTIMNEDIKSGKLLPGTKLPPQRELAYFLGISFNTITKAYSFSKEQGLTYGVVGSGTYISNNANTNLTIAKNIPRHIKDLGFIASDETQNTLIQKTIIKVAQEKQLPQLLSYDYPTGINKHKLIATKYLNQIGMKVNQANTMIVSGGQNALSITLMGVFSHGDKIAVDAFTYANFIEIARLNGITLVPIKADQNGMSAQHLEQEVKNQNVKGVYLMPDCCNPTMQIISPQRRSELAKIIKRHQLILIEDDYLNFINLYRQPPIPQISNLVPEQSIYVCSMSKTLVPGLRIAFMRPANQYKAAIENAFYNLNVKTSSLDAEIITKALEDGTASQIISYKVANAIKANQIFDKIFFNHSKNEHMITLFRRLNIRPILTGKQVEALMLKNNIRIFHSDRFAVSDNHGESFIRISLSSINDLKDLKTTLNKLKSILVKNQLIL